MKRRTNGVRPASARTRPTNTLSSEEELAAEVVTPRSSSKFLSRYQTIKSQRKQSEDNSAPGTARGDSERPVSSKSKFLRKFDKIKEYREAEVFP